MRRYHGLIYFAETIRDPADSTSKDLHTVEFEVKLSLNQYVNLNSVHLCFPIKIKKGGAKTANIDRNMITVNIFFIFYALD